jgi:DNA-binding CsgD family transcriptional regulator
MLPTNIVGKLAANHCNQNSCVSRFTSANTFNRIVDDGSLFVRTIINVAGASFVEMEEQAELTEGQKACLRLVDDHHTSKEIARILGISSFTVDQRLDHARRKLNAANRKDAAKAFAAMELNGISEPFVYETQQLEPKLFGDNPVVPPNAVEQMFSGMKARISVPPIGGARHKLSRPEIISQSLYIAFVSTVAVLLIIVLLIGGMRLFS